MPPALHTSLHLATLLMINPAAAVGVAAALLAQQPDEQGRVGDEDAANNNGVQVIVQVIDFDHLTLAQNCALRDAREQLARSSVAAQCAPAVVREPPATWRYTVDLGGPLDDPRWRRQEADKAACPTAAEVRALTEELSVQDLQVQLEDARAQLRAMQALKRQVMHAVHHLKHRAAAKEASAQ